MAGSSVGKRGKWAEDRVRDRLNDLADRQDFKFMRLPDARAGSFVPTLADFMICTNGRLVLLEVKEVDHPHRLPAKNANSTQRARLRLWHMAGAAVVYLIHFTPLRRAGSRTMDDDLMWRMVTLSYLQGDAPSWDMSGCKLASLNQCMKLIC